MKSKFYRLLLLAPLLLSCAGEDKNKIKYKEDLELISETLEFTDEIYFDLDIEKKAVESKLVYTLKFSNPRATYNDFRILIIDGDFVYKEPRNFPNIGYDKDNKISFSPTEVAGYKVYKSLNFGFVATKDDMSFKVLFFNGDNYHHFLYK